MGHRWVAETRQLHTRKVPRRNKTLPARAARPHFRYKTLPARAARPHFRYKTLPARPKWLDLALFLHAGRVLYRCHHQEAEQGEFCTEHEAELWLANRTPGPTCVEGAGGTGVEGAGGTGVEGTGGFRGTEPGRGAGGRWWSPAAVSTNNRSTHPKQISHAIPPRHGSMHAQKPQNINDQTSTLEIHSGELHAKLVGEWPVGQQAASRRRACPLSGRSAAGQRPESDPWGNKQRLAGGLARSAAREWPVGPQAASRRRACPLSTRSAPAQRLASGPAVPRPRIFSRSASPSEPYQTGMDSGTVHRASGTMASKLP